MARLGQVEAVELAMPGEDPKRLRHHLLNHEAGIWVEVLFLPQGMTAVEDYIGMDHSHPHLRCEAPWGQVQEEGHLLGYLKTFWTALLVEKPAAEGEEPREALRSLATAAGLSREGLMGLRVSLDLVGYLHPDWSPERGT